MRVDVIMPQMGESIQEGTLTRWMKKAGETVKRDEPIFEISTDKVDAEIPAPAAGVLAEIKVTEGATVPINTVVAVIETEAQAGASAPKPAAEAKPAPGPAAPQAAAPPRPSAPAAAPSTPAPAAVAAQAAAGKGERPPGVAADTRHATQGETRVAGSAASAGPAAGLAPAASHLQGPLKPRSEMTPEELRRTRSSPVVRKIAAEHGVDIAALAGTGLSGRVTRKDILGALDSGLAIGPGRPAAPGAGLPPPGAPAPAILPGERTPMTTMRRKIAEHMVLSRRTSAHVTTVFEVDYARIDAIRREKGHDFQARNGVKLTYMPFIARAVIEALRSWPILNASLDSNDVVTHRDVNLGIAVALDWGLIVPVVKSAQDLSLSGLAKAIGSLADRARNKKLSPDDVTGGTFTITNPGIFGGLFGTPIINQPQVAILGVGTVEKRVVVLEGDAIAVRPMGHLALSFDHRLIDGAVADQFMAELKKRLQTWDGGTS